MIRSRFTAREFEHRLECIQRLLAGAGLEALLVFDEANYHYFTGHYTEAWKIPFIHRACWVPRHGTPILVVPPSEAAGIPDRSPWSEIREYGWPDLMVHPGGEPAADALRLVGDEVLEFDTVFVDAIVDAARELGLDGSKPLGLPMRGWANSTVPVANFHNVGEALGATWIDATPLVWEARLVKSEAEIALLREAVHVLDRAFAKTLGTITAGMSEAEIARLMGANMMLGGADHEVFTQVYSDITNFGAPARAPGEDVAFKSGAVICIDAGALYHGYISDHDRLAVIGEPTADQERAYALAMRAQRAGAEMLRPGVTAGDVANAMDNVLADAGAPSALVDVPGHGLGIELPEPPYIHPRSELRLKDGMVLCLEPNVIVDGGPLIVEDTFLVTADGGEHLSAAPAPPELPRL